MESQSEQCSFIQTYTGVKFNLDHPNPKQVNITDIAHALSRLPRFTGHTEGLPYSVAQHSVYVSQIVPPELALDGLLHDATEAYINDLARPVKHRPGLEGYRNLEDRIAQAIALKFNIAWPTPAKVKDADNLLLCTEQRDLNVNWDHREPCLSFHITPWSLEHTVTVFMTKFTELSRGEYEEAA